MRIRTLVLAILPSLPSLLLAGASPALAGPPMVAGPLWAGIDYSLSCKVFNISTKPFDVTIDLVNVESNAVLQTSGALTVAPGGYAVVFEQGVSAQVLCRFSGPTVKKAAATLTLFHSTVGDGTDTVVVQAR
jgi:hypothetical protein